MQPVVAKSIKFTPITGVLFLLLMTVFEAEFTIMRLFGDASPKLTLLQGAFLDALLLITIVAMPLWFFVFSPTLRKKLQTHQTYLRIALSYYLMTLAGLFMIEFLVMCALPSIEKSSSIESARIIDGVLTVVLSAPLFWWLLRRLEIHLRLEPLADLVTAPQTLFVLLLYMIFLSDLMQEFIFSLFSLELSYTHHQLADALLTIILIAPFLYLLVIRPLRRMALSEKARIDIIYDQVVDAIIKVDVHGHIESFNAAAHRIFGIPESEMRGKSANLLLKSEQIDITAELKKLSEYSNAQISLFYDLRTQRFDGKPLNLDLSISKVLLQGPVEYLLVIRDTTQRKATEEALSASNAIFREIFDQTEDAILFFNPGSGDILDVNSTAEKLYGFSKFEFRKLGARSFCDDAAFNLFSQFLAEVEHTGYAQIEHFPNIKKSGERLTASIRGKMVKLPFSAASYSTVIYTTVRDISERIEIEKEAREIQAKLIMANKMTSLGLMVSGVAHEINNPNNYVLANAQMIGKIWNDAQTILQQYYREAGDFILGGIPFSQLEKQAPMLFDGLTDGSHRISTIVKNLKSFARQDRTLITGEVDVNAVITAAVGLLHHEQIRYTENFSLNLADDLPRVSGSAQQLGQVVINLLMNAFQALPDRSCKVEVTSSYDKDAGAVLIQVHDQGAGLDDEMKNKIFTPFYSTKLDSGGTGLGLAISRSIIKDHGGSLEFDSSKYGGTTFTVKLPIP